MCRISFKGWLSMQWQTVSPEEEASIRSNISALNAAEPWTSYTVCFTSWKRTLSPTNLVPTFIAHIFDRVSSNDNILGRIARAGVHCATYGKTETRRGRKSGIICANEWMNPKRMATRGVSYCASAMNSPQEERVRLALRHHNPKFLVKALIMMTSEF